MKNSQFESKIEIPKKNKENDSRSPIKLFHAKNKSKKHLIFEKSDVFANWQKSLLWKGYSLWKMVSLGQKLKLQKITASDSGTTIKMFHAKKQLRKAANI